MSLHLFIIPAQFEAPSQYPLFPLIDHVRRDLSYPCDNIPALCKAWNYAPINVGIFVGDYVI